MAILIFLPLGNQPSITPGSKQIYNQACFLNKIHHTIFRSFIPNFSSFNRRKSIIGTDVHYNEVRWDEQLIIT